MASNSMNSASESGGWWELFQPLGYFVEQSNHHGGSHRSASPSFRLVSFEVPVGSHVREIADKGASNS